ncbi:MAG TPA: carboxypeptidase-like regulatory domain-containing protein, partial [Candidatus Marinimicrobia bacterium]|nr:carboxypeptidase-like regulatory domain-containing protein [Candidatus Neomarinimicrobiota bacterium]
MKRYLKPAFSGLAVMLFINLLNAGVIKGRVIDSKTGDPLIGANLILAETAGIGAASDFKGYYRIDNVPAGEYTLKVTFIGYQPVEIKVSLKADETIIRDIEMVYGGALKGEEVVVTAQAKGQMSAINQQLASNVITNIVDESRIQELPDVNAAESIGRLPGVSIQRSGGEANKVEVRGLNPKYSLITVNGVELPATGSEDRSVNLSLISSNMLDGIVLKKTNTPDMDADVLGGTIDLRLKEAPEGFKFNLSAQGGYNQLQKYYGNYNFTASVSNRFFDNRLGIIVNANTDNYDRSADKLRDNWRNYNEMLATGELFMIEEIVNRKRTGASLLLDYNLPKGKITANGFFNQLNSDGLIRNSQVNTMELGYATNRHYYRVEEEKSKTNVFTSAIGINQDFGWFRYDAG